MKIRKDDTVLVVDSINVLLTSLNVRATDSITVVEWTSVQIAGIFKPFWPRYNSKIFGGLGV